MDVCEVATKGNAHQVTIESGQEKNEEKTHIKHAISSTILIKYRLKPKVRRNSPER